LGGNGGGSCCYDEGCIHFTTFLPNAAILFTLRHALVNARSQALVIALSAGNDADVSLSGQ
jgi:hypothetical protein